MFKKEFNLVLPKVRFDSELMKRILYHKYLYMMILPGFIITIIFTYLPMYGLQLAFKDFMFNKGIWKSPWVGFEHFKVLFRSPDFLRILINTLRISFYSMIFFFPVPIILSLMLNELRGVRFKKITQSVLYIPHFINWVVISGIVYSMFSINNGAVNKVLIASGIDPIKIIGNPDVFRPLLYITGIWKGAGWSTIIFMAALAGIDTQMYESAIIDGANRFKRALHITIPSLKYTIIIMLILNFGGLMNSNFEQIINMINPRTLMVGEVLDTYVYRMGIINSRYDFTTAVGLFKQIINCFLLFAADRIVKLFGEEGFM